jgi:HEPN domain-containing protein
MPIDNPAIIQKVKQWFEIADEDLQLALFAFNMSSPIPYRLIAYHCQQAAEKYLKGLLVYLQIDFPYTHSIERLIELIPKEIAVSFSLNEVNDLTDYAVAKRYPDYYEKISLEDAEKASRLAIQVNEFVRGLTKL